MRLKTLYLLLICLTSSSLFSQEEDNDGFRSKFSFGVNIGGHFANKNTAVIYSGAREYTDWGILRTMNIDQNERRIREHFQQYPYMVEELPFESKYRSTVEIGIHLNYQFSNALAVFADLNSQRLDYEQFMTIEIDNPNNNSPQNELERFPVIGEENRFQLNLGLQYNYYYEDGFSAYLSMMGNVNDVEMRRNYFTIGNYNYEILHPVDGDFNRKPGGVGYGGGIGTGLKFRVGYKIYADIYYTLIYTKTYMNENLQPYGTQHSVGLRVLWQTKDEDLEED